MQRRGIFLLICSVLLIADLFGKLWAVYSGVAHLNTGASFGLGGALPWIVVNAVVLALLARMLARSHGGMRFALGLILVGGVGNVLSRMIWGAVVDWMPMPIQGTNNLADWYIAAGIVWWLLLQYRGEHRTSQPSVAV